MKKKRKVKEGKIIVRIDKAVQEEAERIIEEMGLSPGMAINIFYKQIIFQRKMPFEIISGDSKIHPLM